MVDGWAAHGHQAAGVSGEREIDGQTKFWLWTPNYFRDSGLGLRTVFGTLAWSPNYVWNSGSGLRTRFGTLAWHSSRPANTSPPLVHRPPDDCPRSRRPNAPSLTARWALRPAARSPAARPTPASRSPSARPTLVHPASTLPAACPPDVRARCGLIAVEHHGYVLGKLAVCMKSPCILQS